MRRFPESTIPPRIYPPFQQLYATLPESTPLSQKIPPYLTTIILCDAPRTYPSLTEYTPLSTIICDTPRMYPSRNYPPPPFPTTICYIPRIYPSVTEYSPSLELHVFVKDHCVYVRVSTICDPPRIYTDFNRYMRYTHRIYPSLLKYTPPPFLQL